MIVAWSPHNGSLSRNSSAKAIKYLIAETVRKRINNRNELFNRIPRPETLYGDPDYFLGVLNNLRAQQRYSIATLSFDPSDINVESFNAGDKILRHNVRQAVKLFLEVAHSGVPELNRLKPFVNTHTHAGNLEVNIAMARAVWTSDRRLRAYNPYPPKHRKIFDLYRDVINEKFDLADPGSLLRVRPLSLPDVYLKERAEAQRRGRHAHNAVCNFVQWIVEKFVEHGDVRSRMDLVRLIDENGFELGVSVRKLDRNCIFVFAEKEEYTYRIGGFCFSERFEPGHPRNLYEQSPEDIAARRKEELASAEMALRKRMRKRTRSNIEQFGYELDYPSALPVITPFLRQIQGPLRREVLQDKDRAPKRKIGISFAPARRKAGHYFEPFDPLSRLFAGFLTRIRKRLAPRLLEEAMARLPVQSLTRIITSLEEINGRYVQTPRLGEIGCRAAAVVGAGRAARGDSGPGAGPVDLRADRRIHHSGEENRGPDGDGGLVSATGTAPRGDVEGDPANSARSGSIAPDDAAGYPKDTTLVQRADSVIRPKLTRAAMIKDMHDVARRFSEPIAKMTFFHDKEHGEGLFAAFSTLMLIHDGHFVRDARMRDLFLPEAVRDDDVEPEM